MRRPWGRIVLRHQRQSAQLRRPRRAARRYWLRGVRRTSFHSRTRMGNRTSCGSQHSDGLVAPRGKRSCGLRELFPTCAAPCEIGPKGTRLMRCCCDHGCWNADAGISTVNALDARRRSRVQHPVQDRSAWSDSVKKFANLHPLVIPRAPVEQPRVTSRHAHSTICRDEGKDGSFDVSWLYQPSTESTTRGAK